MRKQIEAAEKMRLALEAQLAALRQELCKSKADMDAMKAMYESKLAALQAEINGAVTLCSERCSQSFAFRFHSSVALSMLLC